MTQRTIAAALDEVTKVHGSGPQAVRALDGVTVEFAADSFTAVMGPSGSGKTTLLQVAAGLERATSGRVELAGRDLGGLSDDDRTVLRRGHAGFVFQSYNLMPTLTVTQNVELPARLAGLRPDPALVHETIDRVGLGGRAGRRPHELSGGERQRVAIARALAARPAVTFADEPTGALDTHVAAEILALLREAVATVVMVTHDPVAAAHAERVLFLADGRIVDELDAPTAEAVAERLTELRDPVHG
jgi:putative ABC transport system ATP-binding protein